MRRSKPSSPTSRFVEDLSDPVPALLTELFLALGPLEHIRSDNGPEFCAIAVRDWWGQLDFPTVFIEPGSS